MKVDPAIANIVLRKQDMERKQWMILLTVFCIGMAVVGFFSLHGFGKPGLFAVSTGVGPGSHAEITPTAPEGFAVNSNGVAMRLHPFGKFTIVPDENPLGTLPPQATSAVNQLPIYAIGSIGWGGSCPTSGGILRNQKINTSAHFSIPPVIIDNGSAIMTSIDHASPKAKITGTVVASSSGKVWFEWDGNNYGDDPALMAYLARRVELAFMNVFCTPAVINGIRCTERYSASWGLDPDIQPQFARKE